MLFQFDPFGSPNTDGNKAEIEISPFMEMRLGLSETLLQAILYLWMIPSRNFTSSLLVPGRCPHRIGREEDSVSRVRTALAIKLAPRDPELPLFDWNPEALLSVVLRIRWRKNGDV